MALPARDGGQGDTGAAEQSPPPPSADSYAAAAKAAAAAAIRLISAHVRVLGEAYVHCGSLPPMPPSAPTRSRMPTPRLRLPPPRAQSVSPRHTSTHVGTRHQRKAAIDKETAAAPNALSVTRDVLSVTRHRHPGGQFEKSLSILGELVECPQLTDSPHFFIRRGLFPRSIYAVWYDPPLP
jgi:hypothetical protein